MFCYAGVSFLCLLIGITSDVFMLPDDMFVDTFVQVCGSGYFFLNGLFGRGVSSLMVLYFA